MILYQGALEDSIDLSQQCGRLRRRISELEHPPGEPLPPRPETRCGKLNVRSLLAL